MDCAELDENEYPTEPTLRQIASWTYEKGFRELMEFIKPCFSGYGRIELRDIDNTYEVATGGWSGCEDVIQALQENHVFWGVCWMLSKRGGYYEFKIRE